MAIASNLALRSRSPAHPLLRILARRLASSSAINESLYRDGYIRLDHVSNSTVSGPYLDEKLIRVRVPEGKHVLEISNPGASRQYPFEGVAEAASNLNRACWIELAAPEMTVQALLGGNMALRIDGLAPLEGLDLTIELEIAGCCVGTTQRLGPLPQLY